MKNDEGLVRCVDMSLVGFLSSEMFDGCTYWEPLDAPRFCKEASHYDKKWNLLVIVRFICTHLYVSSGPL